MAMTSYKFAIFILSYGRPNNVVTYENLRRCGYTGKIYIICSDDDRKLDDYKSIYKDQVIIFSKNDYRNSFDIGDNFCNDKVVVFARNANFDIAKKLGLDYFMQLDDDYQIFAYKIPTQTILLERRIKNLDRIIEYFIEYYKSINVKSLAFAQGGDFIGGKDNKIYEKIFNVRKVMNCYINKTDNPYQFYGRINEDTNCYVNNGMRGDLFITCPMISIVQKQTQSNTGGLTEFYLNTGTYVKSFYTVLFNPSAVKIRAMGAKYYRLHHHVSWNNAVPKIINSKYKKYVETLF
jgi:hypothetical protein